MPDRESPRDQLQQQAKELWRRIQHVQQAERAEIGEGQTRATHQWVCTRHAS